MSANPIDLVGGLATSANVVKADLTAWAKARVPQVLADATEVRNTTLVGQLMVELKTTGILYALDTTDTTTADDGLACIISADGYRFKARLAAASKSDQQSGTSAIQPVTPSQQQGHDSAAKAWALFHWSGSAIVVDASYNIASVTRSSAGIYVVSFVTPFATVNYCGQICAEIGGNTADGSTPLILTASRATGSVQIRFLNQAMSAAVDPSAAHAVFYGRQ